MSIPRPVTRRHFHRLLLAGAAATAWPSGLACVDRDRYTDADVAALARQREQEAARSGKGPDGVLRFRGYRGLAELPWFDLDSRGRLVCTVEDLPPVLDLHTHLGMGMLFDDGPDLLTRTPRVSHLLDCDAEDPGCPLDLDVYINANFGDEDLWALRRGALAQLTVGSAAAATHTIPNLLDEMDDVGVARALVLPIRFGLPFHDDLTERWMAAIRAADAEARLVQGASVHPRQDDAVEALERHAAAGARAVKLHPAAQRFYPDDPRYDPIYEACGRLGLPVLFHGGRAGIEPEQAHPYTLIRHYEGALRRHPDTRFVLLHAGARDVADAIPLARRTPNLWLGIHGQGVQVLRALLEQVGPDRLLFGSDWPFYHLGATLAKVLIVTEGRPEIRDAILRGNGERLLGLPPAPAAA